MITRFLCLVVGLVCMVWSTHNAILLVCVEIDMLYDAVKKGRKQ